VFDVNQGNLLVLNKAKEIVKAYHPDGLSVYGQPPKYDLDWPQFSRKLEPGFQQYWVLSGFFDRAKLPVIQRALDLIKAGVIRKTYFDFATDLMQIVSKRHLEDGFLG